VIVIGRLRRWIVDSVSRKGDSSAGAIKNLDGREPKKVIVVPGRLVNIVG
jgi:hypothetical protein